LIERLLFLVVAAQMRRATPRMAERIKLVDKDNGRRLLAALLEQVAHPGGADPDVKLDKFGAVDR